MPKLATLHLLYAIRVLFLAGSNGAAAFAFLLFSFFKPTLYNRNGAFLIAYIWYHSAASFVVVTWKAPPVRELTESASYNFLKLTMK